jgi:hypothetical protein
MARMNDCGDRPVEPASGTWQRCVAVLRDGGPAWCPAPIVALFLVMGLVACAPALFGGRTFYLRDVIQYFQPQKALQVSSWREGELPAWDPYMQGGQPLLANPNNVALHPLTGLYLLLSPARAFAASVLLHLVAGMLGTAVLVLRSGGSRLAAAFGGISFGFSGVLLSTVDLHPLLLAVGVMPLLVVALDVHLRSGRRAPLAAAALLGSLAVLGGSPEGCLAVGLVGTLWVLGMPAPVRLWRRVIALLATGLGSVGLAAVQVIPAAFFYSVSHRRAGLAWETVTKWSVDPRRLPEILVHGWLGRVDTLDPRRLWGAGLEHEFPYLASITLGPAVVVLAVVGLRSLARTRDTRRLAACLGGLVALGVVVSLGAHLPLADLARPVVRLLPVRYPVKAWLLVPLPAALLSAHGLDVLRIPRAARWTGGALLAVACAAIATALALRALPLEGEAAMKWWFGSASDIGRRGLAGSMLELGAEASFVAVACLAAARGRWGLGAGGILAASCAIALWTFPALCPMTPVSMFSGTPPAAVLARESLAGGRLHADDGEPSFVLRAPDDAAWQERWSIEALRFTTPARHGIPVMFQDDPDGLQPLPLVELTAAVRAAPWPARVRMLARSGVSIVSTTSALDVEGLEAIGQFDTQSNLPVRLYHVEGALPVVRMATRIVSARTRSEAIAFMARPLGAADEVVLEGDPATAGPCETSLAVTSAQAWPDLDATIHSSCDAFMVVSVAMQPGVTFTVDEQAVQPRIADASFMAIPVPAGTHRVSGRYRAPGLRAGAAVSTLALLAACGALSGRRRVAPR